MLCSLAVSYEKGSHFYKKGPFSIQRSFRLHHKQLSKVVDSAIINVIPNDTQRMIIVNLSHDCEIMITRISIPIFARKTKII